MRSEDKGVKFIQPDNLAQSPNYTHVVEISSGKLVYIAGQVAQDSNGNLVGKGDICAQAEQVFKNIETCLVAVGATWNDVVKLSWYLTDLANLEGVRDARRRVVKRDEPPPASTLVQVARLFREEFLIEVEAIAVVAA